MSSKFKPLDITAPDDQKLDILPYPGLRPFEANESEIFFGRDQQIFSIADRLSESHIVTVVGPSGCGKSSLVRAGLLPKLKIGLISTAGPAWSTATMTPGTDPQWEFSKALHQTLKEYSDLDVKDIRHLLEHPENPITRILETANFPPTRNLIVLVDQFEELFRYDLHDERETKRFIETLLDVHNNPPSNFFLVLTMRTDYIGECSQFHGLPDIINDTLYLTPNLTGSELKEAIKNPASLCGGEIEEKLVDRLVNEMAAKDDQLPLMQHALLWMWIKAEPSVSSNIEKENKIFISEKDYLKFPIKGLNDALSNHANEIYENFEEEEKRTTQVLFRQLSDSDNRKREIRRPRTVKDVLEVGHMDMGVLENVIKQFAHPHVAFLRIPPDSVISLDTFIDIGHESLIRNWDKIRDEWNVQEAKSAECLINVIGSSAKYEKDNKFGTLAKGAVSDYEDTWKKDKTVFGWPSLWPDYKWGERYILKESDKEKDFHKANMYFVKSINFINKAKNKKRWFKILASLSVFFLIFSSLFFYNYSVRQDEKQIREEIRQLSRDIEKLDRQEDPKKSEFDYKFLNSVYEDIFKFERAFSRSFEINELDKISIIVKNEFDVSFANKTYKTVDIAVKQDDETIAISAMSNGMPGMLVVSKDAKVLINTIIPKSEIGKLIMDHPVIAFPDKKTVAMLGPDQKVRLWTLHQDNGQLLKPVSLKGDKGDNYVTSVFSQRGEYIYTLYRSNPADCNLENAFILIKRSLGSTESQNGSSKEKSLCLDFEGIKRNSQIKKILIGGSEDQYFIIYFSNGWTRIWNIKKQPVTQIRRMLTLGADQFAISPKGDLLAISSDIGIQVWEIEVKSTIEQTGSGRPPPESTRPLRRLRGHEDSVTLLSFLDDNLLVSGGADGSLRYWMPHHGEWTHKYQFPDVDETIGRIVPLAINSRGRRTIIDYKGRVFQWPQHDWDKSHSYPLKIIQLEKEPSSVAIYRKEREAIFIVGFTDGSLHFWDDSSNNEKDLNCKITNPVKIIALSNDGHQYVAADNSGIIYKGSIEAGGRSCETIGTVTGQKIISLAISGPKVAVATSDGSIKEYGGNNIMPSFDVGLKLDSTFQLKYEKSNSSETLTGFTRDGQKWTANLGLENNIEAMGSSDILVSKHNTESEKEIIFSNFTYSPHGSLFFGIEGSSLIFGNITSMKNSQNLNKIFENITTRGPDVASNTSSIKDVNFSCNDNYPDCALGIVASTPGNFWEKKGYLVIMNLKNTPKDLIDLEMKGKEPE